ncbi:O-antigen ligase-like membrane protein [Actinocorallia herbida]|uniref:O-antigen ligase-like membrane protein n=1 Tax=Actinocorallia herbida TaxID=58109 RepID=A0A3N1CPU2_9ACTN|nr:O-antigen ligase family protein [Actinocorallia herbida]ROO82738.1 O-antigen ligase-like membrane protein [Actinocorallia herbida]
MSATGTSTGAPPVDGAAPVRRPTVDGASLAIVYVLLLTVIPARLVLAGLPISLSPSDIVALGTALTWLCATCTMTLGVAKGRSPVRTALFAFAVACLLSYGLAAMRYTPGDELKLADRTLLIMLGLTGFAIAVCDGVRTGERLERLLKAAVVGGAIMGVFGALQFLFAYDATRLLNLPLLRAATEGGVVLDRGGLPRVASTTGHPIEFGVVCAMLLPLAAHFAFAARDRGEPQRVWWACTGLIASGLLFSVSRSPILGVAVAFLVLLVGWPARRMARIVAGSAGALAVLAVVYPKILRTIYGLFANFGADSSVEYRRHRYEIAQTEFAKHPLFGRGIGTWYVPKYIAFDNQWIMTALDAGAVGVLTLAGILLAGIYACARVRWAAECDARTRSLAVALAAAIAVPVIGALTFDLLAFHIATGLMFLSVGAAGALLRVHRERTRPPVAAFEPAAERSR